LIVLLDQYGSCEVSGLSILHSTISFCFNNKLE
jgi:hypothetical protein